MQGVQQLVIASWWTAIKNELFNSSYKKRARPESAIASIGFDTGRYGERT